ncbi:MAG TPA: hypothetical protein VIY27_11260, partial [Myxococcota bacterium]
FPYAPPAIYLFGFSWAGQVSKRYVFNEKNIRSLARTRDQLWNAGGAAKRVLGAFLKLLIGIPLPAHPILAAFVLAALPLPTAPGIPVDYWHHLVLMQACAIGSLGFYDLAHSLLRKRGLDFKLPGESKPPPPPPKPDDDDDDA